MGEVQLYNYELTLIGQETSYDAIGNPIVTETKTNVLCELKSVGRSEFYNAAVNGMKPEKVFVIHAFEYNKERIVGFEGDRYTVLRMYGEGTEEIELTCERDIGND